MKRRTVLGALGGAFSLTAGCVTRTVTDGPPPSDADLSGSAPTDTVTDDSSGRPDTQSPNGGDDAGAPFEDVPCPSFADTVDRTVCAHTRDGNEPVSLTPSEQVFSPTTGDDTVETLRFTLRNESGRAFGLNPYGWAIKERTADGWSHVAPDAHAEPWVTLDDGETYGWVLSVEQHPSPDADRAVSVTEGLDSGTYAFQITGSLAGETADGGTTSSTSVEGVALFAVDRE
jgi:hypothetical protein